MLQLISFPFIFVLVRRRSHLDEICECFRWLKCQEFVLLLTFGVLAALWLNFLHVCLLIMIYSQCRLSFVLFRCAHLSLFMVMRAFCIVCESYGVLFANFVYCICYFRHLQLSIIFTICWRRLSS